MSEVSGGSMHGFQNRVRRIFRREDPAVPPSDAEEPCGSCGDETAVGSVHYFDRHDLALDDGSIAFLCAECYQRAREAKGGELSDADQRVIATNGLVIGINLLSGAR